MEERYVDPFAPKHNHWELETDESGMEAGAYVRPLFGLT